MDFSERFGNAMERLAGAVDAVSVVFHLTGSDEEVEVDGALFRRRSAGVEHRERFGTHAELGELKFRTSLLGGEVITEEDDWVLVGADARAWTIMRTVEPSGVWTTLEVARESCAGVGTDRRTM